MPRSVADAGKNDHQHGKHSRLQQQAQASTSGKKLGVNNGVNLGTKKAALQLMDGGPSKINPPNSHPSNSIHKAAQSPGPDLKINDKKASEKPPIEKTLSEKHEINKTAVIIGVVGAVALLFLASR